MDVFHEVNLLAQNGAPPISSFFHSLHLIEGNEGMRDEEELLHVLPKFPASPFEEERGDKERIIITIPPLNHVFIIKQINDARVPSTHLSRF